MKDEDEAMHIDDEDVKTDDDVSENDENEAIHRVLNMMKKSQNTSSSEQPGSRTQKITKKDTRVKNKFKAMSPDSKLTQDSPSSKQNGEYTIKAEKLKKTCGAFHEVGGDVMVTVETGKSFDLRSV